MKILYVITKSSWGGAQKYVYDLAVNLPKNDFEVAVAAGGGDGLLLEKLAELGIRAIKIPFLERDINPIKELLSLISLFKILKTEKPDIVHLNSSKIGGLGAVAARLVSFFTRRKILIIFTIHGWGFNDDRFYFTRVVIYFLQWLSVLFCDRVIAVSRAVLNQSMYFPFSKHKFFLIEHGLKPPQFLKPSLARQELAGLIHLSKTDAEDKEFPRPSRGEAEGGLWVGTVAELTKNKGLGYLVEAYNALLASGFKFQAFIIGEGEDRKELEALIAKYKLQNAVYLLGFVPDASKYLKAFDIFVLPSLTEALGYALLEAGYAGLPAVATKVGGIPSIIKNGENGFLVPSKNPEALAEAVKKLLDDEGLRKRIGQKNRELISQKFSFEKILKETEALYLAL